MEKQVIGTKGLSWQTRTVVLCQQYLSFCKEDDPEEYVIDFIPLHEIQSVSIQEVPSDPVQTRSNKCSNKHPPSRLATTRPCRRRLAAAVLPLPCKQPQAFQRRLCKASCHA